jgi:hypothetical protein
MLYQLSHFRSLARRSSAGLGGAESQIRTGDTVIFSHVLYQLSYLGASARTPAAAAVSLIEAHLPIWRQSTVRPQGSGIGVSDGLTGSVGVGATGVAVGATGVAVGATGVAVGAMGVGLGGGTVGWPGDAPGLGETGVAGAVGVGVETTGVWVGAGVGDVLPMPLSTMPSTSRTATASTTSSPPVSSGVNRRRPCRSIPLST